MRFRLSVLHNGHVKVPRDCFGNKYDMILLLLLCISLSYEKVKVLKITLKLIIIPKYPDAPNQFSNVFPVSELNYFIKGTHRHLTTLKRHYRVKSKTVDKLLPMTPNQNHRFLKSRLVIDCNLIRKIPTKAFLNIASSIPTDIPNRNRKPCL